jgi:hypothetical protein
MEFPLGGPDYMVIRSTLHPPSYNPNDHYAFHGSNRSAFRSDNITSKKTAPDAPLLGGWVSLWVSLNTEVKEECVVPAKTRRPTHPDSMNTRVCLTEWITLDSSFGSSWLCSMDRTMNALNPAISLNNGHYCIWPIPFVTVTIPTGVWVHHSAATNYLISEPKGSDERYWLYKRMSR